MKSKDKTKQKKHESTIGKIIYGFLLFMPLLAIGVTCAYVIFNKNAYQSYSEKIEKNYDINELQNGNSYNFKNDLLAIGTATTDNSNLYVNNFVDNTGRMSYQNQQDTYRCSFYINGEGIPRLYLYRQDNTGIIYFNLNETLVDFKFEYISYTNGTQPISYYGTFYNIENFDKLDNVFYYSIDKVEQSPLFNWAEDSTIYTGMNATCNALNITTTFIPLLLTYWLIISVIYFLYDIILIILHVFHHKIHELEESI